MNFKFRTMLLSLSIVSVAALTACGGNDANNAGNGGASGSASPAATEGAAPGKKVTISHAVGGDSPSRDKWMNAIGDAVGTELDIQVLPLEQMEQIYKVKAGTNDLPDLISYHPGARTRDDLQAKDKLMDLSDMPIVQEILEDIKQYYVEPDGKVYGVPGQALKFGGIAYNKKAFADAGVSIPQTLDELFAASEKLKAAGKIPFYLSAKDSWTLQIPGLAAFSYDQLQSPGILDNINANKATFKDAKNFIEAFDTMKKMVDQGYVNTDYLSATYANGQQAIAEGKAAMYPVLTSIYSAILDTYPDKINDLGFFPWPVAGDKTVTVWPPMIYGIPQSSKNADAVKKYIEYFASSEGQKIYFETLPAAGVPAYKGIELDESKLLDPVKEMIGVTKTAKQFATVDFSVVANMGAFGQTVQEILMGQKTGADLAAELSDILAKNAKAKGAPGF
ncbi:MAG: extracellular solute-binding protein family 1 [Paenibacillus sp.]|nr:extracellular solute-binding protein family 1 [Paenibacillus sp.]